MGRMTEFEHGNYVRIVEPHDKNYDCEGEVKSFNAKTGEYQIEITTGDNKYQIFAYSSADLKHS